MVAGYFNTLTPEQLSAISRKGARTVNAARSPKERLALATKASRAAAAARAAKKKGQVSQTCPKQPSTAQGKKGYASHSPV
jgi:hypothetical protein